jgi:hypothetical protein
MQPLITPIFAGNKISEFFIRANRYILNKHKDKFVSSIHYDKKLEILIDLWAKEFSAELSLTGRTPESITFSSKSSMTLFFLKFGT